MSAGGQDNAQWLSVTEETIFLHDGLLRVTDLVELPHDVNSVHDSDHEVVTFDSKSPSDLSERLRNVCGNQNNAYARLLEYRLNALQGYWNALHQLAVEEQTDREGASREETIALLKKQGLWKETEQASFSTRVSLLLCLPLLQSQSKIDPALCGVTAELLLNVLKDCPPLSLTKEPSDCLHGLESLLCTWLGETDGCHQLEEGVKDLKQRENAASALVALTCARGHLNTFIHTVHLLQRLGSVSALPVGDVLQKLLAMDGGTGQPTALLGSKHVVCWGIEDMLNTAEKDQQAVPVAAPNNAEPKEKVPECDLGRSITGDGKFLYVSSSSGRGVAKIGTGLHGTLRGYVYARNPSIAPGWLAWGDGVLLHRPLDFDKQTEAHKMVQVLDQYSLQPLKLAALPKQYLHTAPFTTVSMCGDGKFFYWFWCPGVVADKSAKGQNLYVESFRFDAKEQTVMPRMSRVALQRKEEASGKTINEALLSRLRPYRSASNAATLVNLGGSETQSTRKDDNNTSCGLNLKTLVRTPVYCDGSTVVLLTAVPGGNNSSAARSLFGSSSSLANWRSLACNLCFKLEDGQFITRVDLLDAPTCALARGAPVQGLGVCYDVYNHMLWSCSADWVDQFYNPGHQARHHILDRLAINPPSPSSTPQDGPVEVSRVIRQLLQHVGSMCLHQLTNDLLHTPQGALMVQQCAVDLTYFSRVLDILEKAVADKDRRIIICCLIILQLIFRMSVFKGEDAKEQEMVFRTRIRVMASDWLTALPSASQKPWHKYSELVWQILGEYSKTDFNGNSQDTAIQREVCECISAGLQVLYRSPAERNKLLHRLLTEGDQVAGLSQLRDLILSDFTEQLRLNTLDTEETKHLQLNDELVHYILKIAVRESSILLRDCQTLDVSKFDLILSSVPMASPCLSYLMALQSHLLRQAVLLCQEPEVNEDGDSVETPVTPAHTKEQLHEIQAAVLRLASRVFSGAYEVLEVLLETCNYVIHSGQEGLEVRLAGLERISKATILGHLLPVLLTAKTHPALRCLQIADNLMPQLVQLVVLTSQAALLLKSQVQAIRNDELMDLGSEVDIADLIGEAISSSSLELEEREEQGFLAGLKIPAPWSTGKSVESVHPVRDNYKFKETVHLPGARCLYVRFDPRCSSQYDYDKLVLYAGPNTSARKVAEYGGNTFGYGSRCVLGSGWPRDLVKVEGDTVTLTFEMRSGREHNTPDKAMWGFLVTVRAQECAEEVSGGLPFLADLALGLSVLACTMLHLLYQGPEKTKDEELGQHLLKSKLLQRCVWQGSSSLDSFAVPMMLAEHLPIDEDSELKLPTSPGKKMLPRIRLPSEIMHKLRVMSERQPPQVRPSIKEVIQPDVLEECVLSAAIKHLSLGDTVRHLATHQEHGTEEYVLLKEVMSETYRRIYAMIRQLQILAELEQRWRNEVEELHSGQLQLSHVFFLDFHLAENKTKELACLCFLKDVEMDMTNLEAAVNILREKLEAEVSLLAENRELPKEMVKTGAVVGGLLERLSLLLHVTIAPEGGVGLTRSMSQMPDAPKPMASVMVRSDTDVFKCAAPYSRSLSAPSDFQETLDDSIIEIIKLQRKRQAQRKGPASILQDLVEDEAHDRPPHVILIDQLFSFIGSNAEKAVSCESFLSAARVRWRRGHTRQQALVHMKELLTAAARVGGATHLVAAVTSVLQHGPRVDELTCGGMANKVREAFAETMTSVVQLAARYPIACCNSIGLLCIIPYTRAEEKCLVRCGLLHLLDHLCSLSNYRGEAGHSETQSTRQRVSSMAWAGFQALSNRCVMWEQEDGALVDDLEHSGLARQVSTLLSNHLTRATECSGNEAAGNEALQEVLSLLNNLARSKMGKAILSQPGCVSKLLSLLLDQRPSPKLVLLILQLCRAALPLMTAEDCDKVELPTWGQDVASLLGADTHLSLKPFKIASLLLAKLGDFLVPGSVATVSSRRPSEEGAGGATGGQSGDKDREDMDVQDGRLSVFLHKRDDQSCHEVIQPLMSADNRPFQLGGGANMERVVKMDREMTKTGRAEVTTEDAVSALRKAAKWAQRGLIVSTGPPQDNTPTESSTSDKKKTAVEVVCREKNAELARTDPVRPFISGHVANSLAAEVIGLLHSLLTAPETLAAHTWATAVEKVISQALSCLPMLVNSVEEVGSPRCQRETLMSMAKQANAALAALGGFEETIKPGCQVQVTGPGIGHSPGIVSSVSEATGLATVMLQPPTDEDFQPPRFSDSVQVPVTRLRPPSAEPLPLQRLSMTEVIVMAVQSLLLPQSGGGSPLAQPLPIHGPDGSTLPNQICRVLAEIRTRACKVLARHLTDMSFASAFIQHSSASIDILKSLAKDCAAGERQSVLETQCQYLRMLYRDCAKPPPPPSKTFSRPSKEITWATSRVFPPVRCCLFSHGLNVVTFLGNPSSGSGLPRGTIVYASQSIPQQAPSFYWELEICSFGDQQDDSGPAISFGFLPSAEKRDGAWTNPVGSCLFHNNGRAVHYNGSSLLQWKSVRLDVTLNSGDVAGIGWERQGDSPPVPGQKVRGVVYFTHNGRRLPPTLDDVAGGMWPVVHIQKKQTRVKANFGNRPFAYAEGRHHRNAADECHDQAQEIREAFGALPFHLGSDSDSEGAATASTGSADSGREVRTPPGPACKVASVPKSLREYKMDYSSNYKLLPCYENFTQTGPEGVGQASADDESDDEPPDGDDSSEDHYALLVKAWEQKVFPTIRRRFRNEAERKDGLEQIRGALQLGMTDIARQTVEFLYEENGGMPRDLHLPTIDDIKVELANFTIERVRKGTVVVIRSPTGSPTALPKFAVRAMMKTFGLTGVVLDIDQPSELVQVETYLRSEGVLVRYWYPLDMLERPPQGYRRASIVGQQVLDISNLQIHRELLSLESVLARMHCRTALLELISQCNGPAMDIPCSTGLGSAMAASAALLQELDVENLQLLSNELTAPPLPHGGANASSLVNSPSPWLAVTPHMCTLSSVFYQDAEKLKAELRVAIMRAANQGEDYLIELTNQICICLQTAPETFPYEEFTVNEHKVNTDVHFPGAAFLIVSCKTDPKATKKDISLYKSPWARIYTYRGHRVKRTGQLCRHEVISYPRDVSSSSNHSNQYAPVVIPADYVHIRLGVSPPPGIILTIHAVPPQFPLAATYFETLLSQRPHSVDQVKVGEAECTSSTYRNLDEDATVPSPAVLSQVVELLSGYLWRTDVPALLKEHVFHLLAQTLRCLATGDGSGVAALLPPLSPPGSPVLALLMQLQSELRRLYDEETQNWPTGTTVSGTGLGLGIGDSGRFSTYFHALMEVSLAAAEVAAPVTPAGLPAPTESASSSSVGPPSPSATSPLSTGKRKKLKAKRDRDRGAAAAKRSGSPLRPDTDGATPSKSSSGSSVSSNGAASTSSSSVSMASSKPEDMLWFHRAVTMSQIMRHMTGNDGQGRDVTNDAISDAAQSLTAPTVHGRLLVITGIPAGLERDVVSTALRKACGANGGLYKEELYLPVDLKPRPSPPPGAVAESSPTPENQDKSPSPSNENENVTAGPSTQSSTPPNTEPSPQSSPQSTTQPSSTQPIQGYAIIHVRSRTKLEPIRKALYKSKLLLDGLTFDPEVDMPEEMLSICGVNQQLQAEQANEPRANAALEDYFIHKLCGNSQDMSPEATAAFTEIFHCCYVTEQRMSMVERPESYGYICLERDQILLSSPANLMHTFLNSVRGGKKTLGEQITFILKKYGIPKQVDKEEPDKGNKKPGKKPVRPSKEKLAMATTPAKPSPKEKKSKTSLEKPSRDAAASESSCKVKESSKEEERLLTLDGFLSYVSEKMKQDVRAVWRGLLSCGFDLHVERTCCLDLGQAQEICASWNSDMDCALVKYINHLCHHLAVAPARLHPHEIYLTDAELASIDYACLQGVPCESIRLRFALLQSLNNTLETFFLPLVDLRPALCNTLNQSTASLLANARGLMFYDSKMALFNRVLNATAQRKHDQAAPEVVLDPLENVSGERRPPMDTHYCQALRQLSNVPSSQLNVKLAAGGDPTYSFNVRFVGEEVHGTSGSFRHFLWQVARELESSILDLLIPCPSQHKNRGKYLLKPGKMTYSEEKLLVFFGQLLGITIRADIPLGLDLLPVLWKNMVGEPLDPTTDLQEADSLTYNYIKKFEVAESEEELVTLMADTLPRFLYTSLTGDEVELVANGRNVHVNWENRQQYVDSIRQLRMTELRSDARMQALRSGLASVVPIQMLPVMTHTDMELRTCGLPEVDLDFLKFHTMYQVGLMESDAHIQFFWSTLEGLSQDELRKFIKFACNQERIPQSCPCRDGGSDTAHVPPYPMKIAPPDGTGPPDQRFVRAETCMFMIKLPQYSTQARMTERLLYAIHCREDPLSG